MKNNNHLMPLGRLLNLIEEAGFTVEYQFEDLVFVDHTAFLFRFDQVRPETIYLHFNKECESKVKETLESLLRSKARTEHLQLELSHSYTLQQVEGTEEFRIVFE